MIHYPLHPSQLEIYLDQMTDISSPQYNIGGYNVLTGPLDKTAFQKTVGSLATAFDMFRMRFGAEKGEPYLYYDDSYTSHSMQELDFSNEKDARTSALAWAQQRFNIPFAVNGDALIGEDWLLKISAEEHIYFRRYHHLLCDGGSFFLLNEYLSGKYKSLVEGSEAPAPYPAYREQSAKAIAHYGSEDYRREGAYWKENIGQIPPKMLRQSPVNGDHGGRLNGRFILDVSSQQKQRLEKLGETTKSGLPQLTIAALTIYFGKTTAEREFLFGLPIHRRRSRPERSTVGLFAGVQPFKGIYNGDQSVAEMIKEITAAQRRDFRNSSYLMADLSKDLGHSGGRLTDILINYELINFELDLGPEMETRAATLSSEYESWPLHMRWREQEKQQQLQLYMDYRFDYFPEDSAQLLAERLLYILEQLADALEGKARDIKVFGERERQQLLTDFNDTQRWYPRDKTVVDLFQEQADRRPGAIAVIAGEEQISYRELDERSNQLAHYLRSQGVGAGSLVPVCLPRGLSMAVSMLGVLKTGGAYIPIDTAYPEERIAYILEDSRAKLALMDVGLGGRSPEVRMLNPDDAGQWLSTRMDRSAGPEELIYMIYTSGSTGRPKGVMVRHRNVMNMLQSMADLVGFGEESRMLSPTTCSFDIFVTELYLPLTTGGRAILAGREDILDGPRLARLIARHAPTHMQATPSLWKLLLAAWWKNPERLRVLVGGEALKETLKDQLTQLGEVFNCYGPTETTVWSTVDRLSSGEEATIGRPIANTQIYILGADGALLPRGVAGEICIAGDGVTAGYWERPGLTGEKFIDHLFGGSGKIYRTGDTGQWLPDGRLRFLGRKDDQVKIRGHRVEPGEIDNVLLHAPDVAHAVVVAKENSEGEPFLTAYIVPGPGYNRGSLIRYAAQRLPEYMMPSVVVEVDRLPVTANGKIDRKALAALDEAQQEVRKYAAPENLLERTLVEIWQTLLERERIGVTENFFEIGGNSIMATRLVSAVGKELDIELFMGSVFEYPTVRTLAKRIARLRKGLSMPPVTAKRRPAAIPLSYTQERLWFLHQLGGSEEYHQCAILRLLGRLDRQALETAIRTAIGRHETLRTVYREEEGIPYQTLLEEKGWQLETSADELTVKPFDLTRDYMLRAHLAEVNTEEHQLLLVAHHIAYDGWSQRFLLDDIKTAYIQLTEGREVHLQPLPIQYADYAIWQQKHLTGDLLQKKLDYWRDKLRGVAPLHLPADHPRPAVQSKAGSMLYFTIERELTDRLRRLGLQNEVTLFMTLLAAFKVLLHRYSGQDDICVGTVIANRGQREIESLVGFFANTLALRSDLSGDPSFTEFLRRVRQTTLEAYEHQEAPFGKVVSTLIEERDMSRSPLFQVMFLLQNAEGQELAEMTMGDVRMVPVPPGSPTSAYDMTLLAEEKDGGVLLRVIYCTDLFEEPTVLLLLNHYRRLLLSICENADMQVSALRLTGEEEERRLLEWGSGPRQLDQADTSVAGLFAEQVDRTPLARAVTFGDRGVGYQELDRLSSGVAHALQQRGVGRGARVGICANRGIPMIAGIIGVLKTGAAYVPIDPEYPAERIAYMLDDSKVALVLTDESIEETRDWTGDRVLADQDGEDLVYLIYTSGSTGRPKGVAMPGRAMLNLLHWQHGHSAAAVSDPTPRVLQFASINFDVSFQEIFSTLCFGGELVLVSEQQRMDMQQLLNVVKQHSVTQLFLPCAVLQAFCEHALSAGEKVESLKAIYTAGEQLRLSTEIQEFTERSGAVLVNQYGPSETHVVSSYRCTSADYELRPLPPIGRPVSNTYLYILDKNGNLCPAGVPGELYIGGIQVARGYWNKESLTADRFVPDGFAGGGATMYRTGDLARWLPEKDIEFLGRADDQVKIRGYRVELGEIESVLQEAEGVRQGVVLVREDAAGNKHLTGYAVLQAGYDAAGVIAALRLRLPAYMVPGRLIAVQELPLTNNGKVDRRALASLQDTGAADHHTFIAAHTDAEKEMTLIWQHLLGAKRIGITDNFFERGGHSLLAMRLVSAIRSRMGVELPVREVFTHPTIAELAAYAGTRKKGLTLPPLVKEARPEDIPLSYAQERLWVIHQLEGSLHYHIPAVFRLHGGLEAGLVEKAFREVVSRHEILRTVYEEVDGKVFQRVKDAKGWRLQLVPDGAASGRMEELAAELAGRPFRLDEDYLLRAWLVGDGYLVVVMHHIAADGWWLPVLAEELQECYTAFAEGREPALRPMELQYADYAVWQRKYMTADLFKDGLEYWKEQLKDTTVLELPVENGRPALTVTAGAAEYLTVDAATTAGLHALGRREGATLFMVLLSAYKALLYRYTGADDICVGSATANRLLQETEAMAGFFVNTVALRSTGLSDNPAFSGLLRQVKETTLSAYEHQAVPFEMVVEAVVKERDLSRSPLFQVMFDLQNNAGGEIMELQFGGTRLSREPFENKYAKYELSFSVYETAEGLKIRAEYSTVLFSAAMVQRMLGHYRQILQTVADDADQRIGTLPMLSKEEERQLVDGFNGRGEWRLPERTVVDVWQEQASRIPDAVAVVYGEGKTISYRDLEARSNQLAHYLRAQGVGPATLVPVCLHRSVEVVIAILSIWKAGGAYIPIDPDYPGERRDYILRDSAATQIIDEGLNWSLVDLYPAVKPEGCPRLNDLAYVIYTSGTTGRPKGVMIEHASLANYLLNNRTGYIAEDDGATGSYVHLPFTFDASVTALFMPLVWGRSIVLAGGRLTDLFAEDLFRGHQPYSFIKLTPAHLPLLEEAMRQGVTMSGAGAARRIVIGGEALYRSQIQYLAEMGFRGEVINEYGPTEATVGCSVYRLHAGEEGAGEQVPIGVPIDNMRIYIVSRDGALAPVGVAGEIIIAGAGVARGYLNQPQLTAERFSVDPFDASGKSRCYRTGDLARRLADGTLVYTGRIDDLVKHKGYRIELQEIESVLLESGLLTACAVLLKKDDRGSQLAAYVVPNGPMDWDAVIAYLQAKLPSYMIPSQLVEMSALPLTRHGKVDKARLMNLVGESPASGTPTEEGGTTPTADAIIAIWKELLDLDEVGPEDNFFALGGDSILAIQAVSRIRKRLDADLQLSDLFEQDTVQALAGFLEEKRQRRDSEALVAGVTEEIARSAKERLAALGAADADAIEDVYPMKDIQQGMVYSSSLHREEAMYHDQFAHQIRMPGFSIDRFRRAFALLVAKHPALRTRFLFDAVDGVALEVVQKSVAVRVDYIDLRGKTYEEQEAVIGKFLLDERARPFDISRAPLWRADVFRTGDDKITFLFQFFHAILDGWSRASFNTELIRVYERLGEDGNYRPAPLKASNRDGIISELVEKKNAGAFDFWAKELYGYKRLDLFTAERSIDDKKKFFDTAFVRTVRRAARENNIPLKNLFFAAYLYLLNMLTFEDDIVCGMITHNRPPVEDGEKILGCFVNSIPVRYSFSDDTGLTWREFFSRANAAQMKFRQRERTTLVDMARHLGEISQVHESPFFDTVMNYTDFHVYGDLYDQDLDKAISPELRRGLAGDNLDVDSFEMDNTFFGVEVGIREAYLGMRIYLARKTRSGLTALDILGYFERIVDAWLRYPDEKIDRRRILGESWWRKNELPAGGNGTGGAGVSGRRGADGVVYLFQEQAAKTPGAIAIRSGEEAITYDALDRRSSQLAAVLRGQGVGEGSRVLVCMDRGAGMIVSMLAVWKAGAVYIPMDLEYPVERIRYIMSDSGARILIGDEAAARRLPDMGNCRFVDWTAVGTGDIKAAAISSSQPAYVIYTSGSTGLPKGVLASHGNLVHFIRNAMLPGIGKAVSMPFLASNAFDISLFQLLTPLLTGGTCVVAAKGDLEDAERLAAILKNVDAIDTVPAFFATIIRHIRELGMEEEFGHIRQVFVGGDLIPDGLLYKLSVAFPSARIVVTYGPTEASIFCTKLVYAPGTVKAGSRGVLIGRPIEGTVIRIVDRNGGLLPPGVEGEICIGGGGVTQGYLNQESLTTRRFIQDELCPEARWYLTGDLGRWTEEGVLEFRGRRDEQVKIRGYRIEPGEIENRLRQHPGIADAAVVSVPGPDGEAVLAAYYMQRTRVQVWPSISEYLGYNDIAYYAMNNDDLRAGSYRKAIEQKVKGKVVVDVGTGPEAILARHCIAAGARRVYAIEILEDVYHKAKVCVESLGLEDRIILIHGNVMDVQLPEKADYCVCALVGNMGSSDGCIPIMNSARRLLKDPRCMIPYRSVCHIAAIDLPEEAVQFALTETGAYYADNIFSATGSRFDLRVGLQHVTQDQLISTSDVFEDLDLTAFLEEDDEHPVSLGIIRDGIMHGFLVWLHLYTSEDIVNDIFQSQRSFLPVYFPVFGDGAAVRKGDRIQARVRRIAVKGGIYPDYAVEGELVRAGGERTAFSYVSARLPGVLGSSPFYRRLFDGAETPGLTAASLGAHLEASLPQYMIPASFTALDKIPLTANGKVDRQALKDGSLQLAATAYTEPRTDTERRLITIWQTLLGIDRIGSEDDFFQCGGHSLLAMRMIYFVKKEFGVTLSIKTLFELRTVAQLSELLDSLLVKEDGESVAYDIIEL